MKPARKQLALSLISLLLCFSMLLGTTWAWFTDSVTSTNNRIATGTLDIDLEYYNDGNWEKVTDSTNVFEQGTLWEPGHTEVVYLKISNLGSLALKYDFGINIVSETIGTNVSGEKFLLSDYIRYGVDEGKQPEYSGREEAVDAVKANSSALNSGYSKKSTMKTGDPEVYVALVVYMPETVGNVANAMVGTDAPTINLGITLKATQYTIEDDTFGTDYDTGALFPDSDVDITVTAPVEIDENNKVVSDVTLGSDDNVSAVVSAETLLEAGTDYLTLNVTELDITNGDITVSDGEQSRSVDVHVDGIADGNTVPVVVTVRELMPIGLNMGNYTLYHVENGMPVAMTYVTTAPANHNEFAYDPATGDVVIALCSFSEVAVVAETEAAWEGGTDYSWYDVAKTEYTIANGDQLVAFARIVGGMTADDGFEFAKDTFADKTVKLIADINLGDDETHNVEDKIFYPIGYYNSTGSFEKVSGGTVTSSVSSFSGTFDGNGHTVANFYQNTWDMFGDYNDGYSGTPNHYKDAMGLFGYVNGGTVKNLTVDNFSSDGEFTPTGSIAAYACNATFENIAITNCNPRVYNTGNGGIVGIGGNSDDPDEYKLTFKNITIDNTNKITALWGSWDVACGGLVGMFRGAGHAYMTNCHVAAQIDAYNDVCGNYQYYWYRYSGMLIGTNKNMTTDDKGYTVPETDKYHAENCTVHFDKWNDYYYCELVANSLASYTHDHQFSRLELVKSVDVNAKTYVTLDNQHKEIGTSGRYNFVTLNGEGWETENATCYHFVNGAVHNHEDAGYDVDIDENKDGKDDLKEDKQHVYLPFNQLFTGYGWGVKHVPVGAFDGVTILEREVADSQTKFVAKYDNNTYRIANGFVVSLGELFDAVDGMEINNSGVWVSVEAVGDSTVTGKFTANTSNWRNGTLTFRGEGVAKLIIQDYDYCTPTTLYIDVDAISASPNAFNNKIVGLSENLNYEYATVNALGFSEWTDVPVGSTEFAVENGLYAIRVKAGDGYEASAEEYVYINDGSEVRDVLWTVRESDSKRVPETVKDTTLYNSFNIGYWNSTIETSDNSMENYYKTNYMAVLVKKIYLAEDDATAFSALKNYSTRYSMKSHQIVPIKELKNIKAGYNCQGIGNPLDTSDVTALVRIYVAGSEVPYYDIEHVWNEDIDVQAVLPENAHGYVTAIQFFPYYYIPEDATAKSGSVYVFLYLHTYDVKDVEEIGEITTEGYLDGCRILGLEADKLYAISTNGTTWTNVPAGSTSVYVEEVGNCYIKALGAQNGKLDSKVVTVDVSAVQATVTGLTYADGKITGLDSEKTYEYKVLNINDAKWTETSKVTEIEVGAGVWAVRLAATEELGAGAAQYVLAQGEKYGTIAWGKHVTQNADFVQGIWTSGDKNPYFGTITSGGHYTLQFVQRWAGTYENRMQFVYRYALEDGEVFPVSNLGALTLTLGFGSGAYFTEATGYTSLVRVYVADGEQDYYEITNEYSVAKAFIVDLQTVIPEDAQGYVTAIEVYPCYEVHGGTANASSHKYPFMILGFYDTDPENPCTTADAAKAAVEKWRCCLAVPEFVGTPVINQNTLTGLDAGTLYEYAPVNALGYGDWVDVGEGVTEMTLANGLYVIRVKGKDGGHPASEEKYVYAYDGVAVRDVLWTVDDAGKRIPDVTSASGFNIGYWHSHSEITQAKISSYCRNYYMGTCAEKFTLSTNSDTAFSQLLAINTTYAMKPDQIVPIEKLKTIQATYTFSGAMGVAVLEGMNSKNYTALIRIYVAGSDVEYYDIQHAWLENINIQSKLPEGAHGYVTAIQFFPFAFIPSGATVQNSTKDDGTETPWASRTNYAFLQLYNYDVE